jgi:hypothetical protein
MANANQAVIAKYLQDHCSDYGSVVTRHSGSKKFRKYTVYLIYILTLPSHTPLVALDFVQFCFCTRRTVNNYIDPAQYVSTVGSFTANMGILLV